MQFKNLQLILVFITYVSFVLSSPIEVKEKNKLSFQILKATEEMQSITDKIKITEFRGDDGVDALLEAGGFDNDINTYRFILKRMGYNVTNVFLDSKGMGCSAFQTPNEAGDGYYFGRNFDWNDDFQKLIMVNHPDNGYSSISTVNTKFINWVNANIPPEDLLRTVRKHPELIEPLPEDLLRLASLFIPLDGVNEKGLSISVNQVPGEGYNQNKEGLRNLTTGSANRVLLNKAATVDEAVEILKNSNLHATLGINIHYLIADANGNSVTVEYANNTMSVIDTKLITNFYLTTESKGQGGGQDRYDNAKEMMDKYPYMTIDNARDTLEAAKQENNTQWSVVYDQKNLEATYFFNMNYEKGYQVKLLEDDVSDDETLVVTDDETTTQYDSADEDSDNEN